MAAIRELRPSYGDFSETDKVLGETPGEALTRLWTLTSLIGLTNPVEFMEFTHWRMRNTSKDV